MGSYACTESPINLEQQFSVSSPSKAPTAGARLSSALARNGVAKDGGAFMRVPEVTLCCTASGPPSSAVVAVSQMSPGKPRPQLPQSSFDAFTGTYVDSATGEQATLIQDAHVVTLACTRWGIVIGRVSGDTISVTLSVAPSGGPAHTAAALTRQMTLQGHVTDGQIRWSDGTVWDLEVVKEGTMLLLPSQEDDRNNPDLPESLDPLPEDADSGSNVLTGTVDDALDDLAPRVPPVPPTRSAGAAEPTPQSAPKDSSGPSPSAEEPREATEGSDVRTMPQAESPKTKVPPPPPFDNCERPM